jgi:hypothetical protein
MSRKSAKNRFLLFLLLGCSLLFTCPGCEKGKENREETSFEIDKLYERGPLTVHVRLDKSKITIAETVILELEAAIKPDYGIVDWDNLGNKLDQNNNIVSTYRYRLEPFLSGNYAIPAFTFEFSDANGIEEKKYELTTEPIDIEVTSLLGEQRSELVIADIEDVVEMPQEASYWWIWAIGLICIITAIGTWLYLRRKRHAKLIRIFKPAHEIAYERLQVLVKDDLIKAGEIKEFYERISNILRHYIEHRFELRAPERTTEEFLIELQWTDVLSAPDKETIVEFLRHCDLVKFAEYNPTSEQIQQTFNLVKDFIEKTKSDERRIDVTDKVDAEETVEAGVV